MPSSLQFGPMFMSFCDDEEFFCAPGFFILPTVPTILPTGYVHSIRREMADHNVIGIVEDDKFLSSIGSIEGKCMHNFSQSFSAIMRVFFLLSILTGFPHFQFSCLLALCRHCDNPSFLPTSLAFKRSFSRGIFSCEQDNEDNIPSQ